MAKSKPTTLSEVSRDAKGRLKNTRHELFCQYYASQEYLGNGTQSYILAYNINPDNKSSCRAARQSAFELLTRPDILTRINEVLELGPLNDEMVDAELAFVIQQRIDLPSKVRAIGEYNKLKQRVTEKLKVEIDKEVIFKMEVVRGTQSQDVREAGNRSQLSSG